MTTAPAAAPSVVRSVPVPDPGPLLDLLPRDGALAWVRDGEGVVGWGAAAQLEVRGRDRFRRAARWWRELSASLTVDDRVRQPGSGALAFGSFTFDDGPGVSTLVLPTVVVGRRNGTSWVTTVDGPLPPLGPRSLPAYDQTYRVRWSEGSLPVSGWQAAVAESLRRIEHGDLEKVVLARDLLAEADTAIDLRSLLRRLGSRYPGCWTFTCRGLVGATPELLLRRYGDRITSRVLAGTAQRQAGTSEADLADRLLRSAKDLEEHRLAVRTHADAFEPHTDDLVVPPAPTVLSLPNVLHLATEIQGRLSDGSDALGLLDALHPNAAVCGRPVQSAMDTIRELEHMDRGRYAGPIGWVDAGGDGEWGIALRCAEVSGRQLRLFAGCGIVAGSDPDAELAEAQAKFLPLRDALEP